MEIRRKRFCNNQSRLNLRFFSLALTLCLCFVFNGFFSAFKICAFLPVWTNQSDLEVSGYGQENIMFVWKGCLQVGLSTYCYVGRQLLIVHESKRLFTHRYICLVVSSFKARVSIILPRLVLVVALLLSFCLNVLDQRNVVFEFSLRYKLTEFTWLRSLRTYKLHWVLL